MQTTIEQVYFGHTRKYIITYRDDSGRLMKRNEFYYLIKKVKHNNFMYLLLFDNEGNYNKELYKYLNIHKSTYSDNYRIKIGYVLKTLFEFCKIYEIKPKDMLASDFTKLVYFIKGDSNSHIIRNLQVYKSKSYTSIQEELTILHDYFKYNRYKNASLINEISVFKQFGTFGTKYIECPKFISQYELQCILEYVNNDDEIDEETRMKFSSIYLTLFYTGLRVGELLGLTMEDFELCYDNDGNSYCKIYIRNRLSDNICQCAKRVMSIKNKNDYNSVEYQKHNIGFQYVIANESIYYEVMNYFDVMSNRLYKLNKTPAVADAVTEISSNYYIYNNLKTNTPLNVKMLYTYTRKVFLKLGIPISSGKKYSNLLHRFRHGFVMYMLYVKNIPPHELITFTRHASEQSLLPYINPTEEMLAAILNNTEEEINEYFE